MRKLFLVLVSLLLASSVAFAIDADQSIVNELGLQSKGNCVTSDSSVLFNIWYVGSGDNPAVGVSSNTAILLYADASSTSVSTGTYDTVKEVVDYIDGLDDWEASVGKDAYDDLSTAYLLAETAAAPTSYESSAYTVQLDASSATYMTAGVVSKSGRVPRLKSIDTSLATSGNIVIKIYDGNTKVWQKAIGSGAWTSSTNNASSANTIKFTDSLKGLAGTAGNPLVVIVDTDSTFHTDSIAKNANTVSIIYDQIAQ